MNVIKNGKYCSAIKYECDYNDLVIILSLCYISSSNSGSLLKRITNWLGRLVDVDNLVC